MATFPAQRAPGSLAISMIPALIALACSSTMNNDNAGKQMNLGINETRSGLSQTETGLAQINGNSRAVGMSNIDSGMITINRGVTDMHSGMDMMASGMMMNCMDGGATGMMNSVQCAVDEMRLGQMMLAGDASENDTDAITHMSNGQAMMRTALDQANSSMNCMGHGHMMPGGMM